MTVTSPAAMTRAVDVICAAEQADISRRYGTMERPGRVWLPFHNATHSADVEAAAVEIGTLLVAGGRLTQRDIQLLRVAASFHDHEQGLGPGANEAASADAAVAVMRRHRQLFDEADCAKVRRAIMGTVVSFPGGVLTQQVDGRDTFSCVLADADLSAFGKSTAIHRALMLDLEFQRRDGTWSGDRRQHPDHDASVHNLAESVQLFANHRHHLPESRALFAETQVRNHDALAEMLERFRGGTLSHAAMVREGRGARVAREPALH